MQRRKSKFVTRILQRILAPGRGEVRAMEQALQMEGILRFVGLIALMVLLPAAILAWYGMSSMTSESMGLQQEVEQEANLATTRILGLVEEQFSGVESRVSERLEEGQSPLVGLAEIHSTLLVVFRLTEDDRIDAPFDPSDVPVDALLHDLFEPDWLAARQAEMAGDDPALIAGMYADAARRTVSPGLRGRALLDQGRMLGRTDQPSLSEIPLRRVMEEFGDSRDPWGFVLGDLARLELAGSRIEFESGYRADLLDEVVRGLLERRWRLGWGTDASIARRTLSLLQELPGAESNASDIRAITERVNMHYWAGQLWPELQRRLNSGGLDTVDGLFVWSTGERAVWGFVEFEGAIYALALDRTSWVGLLRDRVTQVLPENGRVVGTISGPNEPIESDALSVRSLSPWLVGSSLAISARDPAELSDTSDRRKRLRLLVILLTLGLISMGVFLSARQIKRELDMARMQADFAANVSHELRSPITQIRLKGEMLMLGMVDEEEERSEAYQAIVRESERLSRLVDNVLDFGAIERGLKQYDLRPADLSDTIHRAVDIVSSSQEVLDKTLDIVLPETLPYVEHDPDAIAQCVINLVSNAAKYSGSGGWIGVRSRVLQNSVEITISDRGIGIRAEDLKNVFEPFFRSADKDARLRKGTGIGLTITRYIMRAHGGEVSVQSRPGIGSTFTLRFPSKPGDTHLYS